jgi:hypothetical protein
MAEDGSFKVKFPSPLPQGDVTEFSHADCYMRSTRNCSEDIAAGYYFSEGLRDLLRTKVIDATFPWDESCGENAVHLEDIPSSLLCGRHNEALASLDAAALRAFHNMLDAVAYVTVKSLATKTTLCALSGESLELWLLKLLFGACHFGRHAGGSEGPINLQRPDFSVFQNALEKGALAVPGGIYVRKAQTDGGGRNAADQIKRINGFNFTIGPLECELLVDTSGIDLDQLRRQSFYRPSGIDLIGKKRNAQIHLSGSGFATNETARIGLSELRQGQ